jgi:hypothetical protein
VAIAAEPYPDHIVNGDFEYPSAQGMWFSDFNHGGVLGAGGWSFVSPDEGSSSGVSCLGDNQAGAVAGFDRGRFGWSSSQGVAQCPSFDSGVSNGHRTKANMVEVRHDEIDGNMFGEITAEQAGTYLYQDIRTVPGAVYTWSLKHASNDQSHVDGMQVLIGAPGDEKVSPATRVASENGLDPVGYVGDTIRTHKSDGREFNPRSGEWFYSEHGQWATYRGTYVVPAGQTVTRFTFKAVNGPNEWTGNEIDDVSFQIAYPLHYDMNGGADTSGKLH